MFRKPTKTKPPLDIEPIDLGKAPEGAISVRKPSESSVPARRESAPARSARPARADDGTPRGDIPVAYKGMIIFSFALNLLLVVVVLVLGFMLLSGNGIGVAREPITELDDIVSTLQTAHVKADVPLDTHLPIQLQVPVNQDTVVITTQPVPISVPAHIIFPGGGGSLNTSVNLELPVGLVLPVHLETTIPLTASVPVKLNVPVDIPLSETDLGPAFTRLRELIAPLVKLIAPPQKKE